MNFLYLFFFLLIISPISKSGPTNCNSENARQFDFWIGDWNLTWRDKDGNTLKGKNVIKSLYGGCVIQENFEGDKKSNFKGMSISVYNSRIDKWQQTWVDNSGAYLDFTGEFKDGKMILSREAANKEGKTFMQRMIFYNISKDSLDWNWERSVDNGQNWQVLWKIHYLGNELMILRKFIHSF